MEPVSTPEQHTRTSRKGDGLTTPFPSPIKVSGSSGLGRAKVAEKGGVSDTLDPFLEGEACPSPVDLLGGGGATAGTNPRSRR